jgi:hypothetical protein
MWFGIAQKRKIWEKEDIILRHNFEEIVSEVVGIL